MFCLFASKDASTADPLDLAQWEFYVLSTNVLNEQVPNQKQIGLGTLLRLGAQRASFLEVHSAVIASAKDCQTLRGI